MPTTEKPANGVRGCLINTDDGLYFRVYQDERDAQGHRKFIDYKLRHDDLFVIIDDKSASLYEREEPAESSVDYSSKVLGKVPK